MSYDRIFDLAESSDEAPMSLIEQRVRIRDAYAGVQQALSCLPNSREKSVVITNLETSALWAAQALKSSDLLTPAAPAPPRAVIEERKRIAEWIRRIATMHSGIVQVPLGIEGDNGVRYYMNVEQFAAMIESGDLPEKKEGGCGDPSCGDCTPAREL